MEPEIIEGIPCYAPKMARDNTGYHPEALTILSKLESDNFWYISRNAVLKKVFKRFLKDGKAEVMEVGCGNGTVLRALAELKNIHFTGADIYLTGVQFAKLQVPGVDFIQMDAENIPFTEKFDAIGCFDVLEHIENDTRVLSQLHKALKHNAKLFITVPQYPWLWSEIDEIDRHKRRYTRTEIIKKITMAGFTVQHVNCFAFAVFPITLLSRLGKKRKKADAKIDNNPVRYPEIQIPEIFNVILRFISRMDEFMYSLNIKLPFGSSILLVATKK
ncbi:MAG: class I SAM-dependent methyltransferase [Bacteroidetes bacterium]|nr:MAG: class I SAM-dependent methyltransferase [Bacteroidota bacterium]